MQFRNLSIRFKVTAITWLMLLMSYSIVYYAFNSLELVVDSSTEAQDTLNELNKAKIAHLSFVAHAATHIIEQRPEKLNLTSDGTKCDFGKWYYGTATQKLHKTYPNFDFDRLEEDHHALHSYIDVINDFIAKNDYVSVNKIYSQEITPILTRLLNELNALQGLVQAEINLVRLANEKAEQSTRIRVIIAAILTFIISLILLQKLRDALETPLKKLNIFTDNIVQGNYNATLAMTRTDEIGLLGGKVRQMVEVLKVKLEEVNKHAEEALVREHEMELAKQESEEHAKHVEETSVRILQASHELDIVIDQMQIAFGKLSNAVETSKASGSESSEHAYQTASAMTQMNTSANEIARNSENASQIAHQSKQIAEKGLQDVEHVMRTITNLHHHSLTLKDEMTQLSTHADAIGSIMTVISDIADQTNLLALNAAIEAARAGDAGRGFAVVADEVRKLAEKTMTSTVDVREVVTSIQASISKNIAQMNDTVVQAEKASELSSQSENVLREIVVMVENSEEQIIDIASASNEQAQVSEEISTSINVITDNINSTADAIDLVQHTTEDLLSYSNTIAELSAGLKKE